MTHDAQAHDLARIRQLLLAAFTPEELRRFCYDRATFRPVVNRFGPGHGLDDMVDELITYSDKYILFADLLAEVKQHNPRQYAHAMEPQLSKDEPAPLNSGMITIASPISLQLVRVSAGEFQMGSIMARDKGARENELPPHPVYVPEFHISRYPVTNYQYRAFVRATSHQPPQHWDRPGRIPLGKENQPVTCVSWFDALAFCAWLAQETGQPTGLPTEAGWEKAARGVDGRIYPWGNEPPDENLCNFQGGVGDTTPIGRYSPQGDSPYGCAEMAGNVWEWCQSLHRPYPYQADDGREALEDQGDRALRGGAFFSHERDVRCAYRSSFDPGYWDSYIGFRVAVAPGAAGL